MGLRLRFASGILMFVKLFLSFLGCFCKGSSRVRKWVAIKKKPNRNYWEWSGSYFCFTNSLYRKVTFVFPALQTVTFQLVNSSNVFCYTLGVSCPNWPFHYRFETLFYFLHKKGLELHFGYLLTSPSVSSPRLPPAPCCVGFWLVLSNLLVFCLY